MHLQKYLVLNYVSHTIDNILKMNRHFRAIMPCNLYGYGDNYDLENSHVIPALIQKYHDAKINNKSIVKVWGTGNAKREFMFVDDMAEACIKFMNIDKKDIINQFPKYKSHINVGSGNEITIKELSKLISRITNFEGKTIFENNQLEGLIEKF